MRKEKGFSVNRTVVLVIAAVLIVSAIFILENPFRQSAIKTPDKDISKSIEVGTLEGQRSPDVVLKAAFDSQLTDKKKGDEVKLNEFKGKIVLLNSWAAWCPFCIDEMPLFQKISNEREDLVVLFIHRTKTESIDKAKSYLDEFQNRGIPITDPVLEDPGDDFYTIYTPVAGGMPITIIVDKDGVIRKKKAGPFTEEELRLELDKIEKSTQVAIKQVSQDEIKILEDGTKYIIHPDKFLSGGPQKDGIPSIDNPKFVSASEAIWLPDKELGLGIVYKGEARFYPYRILVFHEIVNDKIQEDPILITYCPLCFTGIAFERRIDGEAVEFGVSGKLYNSELVMYDRKTDSYWPQSLGKAVVGSLTGTIIKKLPVDVSEWGSWKKVHSDTKVLSKDTGIYPESRYSGSNPYGQSGNFTSIGLQFPLENNDDRLPDYEIVYGIEVNGSFKAYKKSDLEKLQTIEDLIAGEKIKLVYNKDLGSAKAFKGSEEIIVETLFWFAWAAFHPDTELYS